MSNQYSILKKDIFLAMSFLSSLSLVSLIISIAFMAIQQPENNFSNSVIKIKGDFISLENNSVVYFEGGADLIGF